MNSTNPFPAPIAMDGTQSISASCSDSDLVKVVNGGLVRMLTLINVPTNGANPLSFSMTYDSQSINPTGSVGANWFHNYQMNLAGLEATMRARSSTVTATLENGVTVPFVPEGGGPCFTPPLANNPFLAATLINLSDDLWQLTFFPDGGYYAFNGSGVLQQIVDADSNTLSMAYNDSGQLESVTEGAGGRQIQFGYTGSLLTSVQDPNGNFFTLSYDEDQNLTGVIGPAGCVTSYGYSVPSDHLITSRTDPNGHIYSYQYNEATPPQLVQVQDAEPTPNTISYTYDTVYERVSDNDAVPYFTLRRTRLTDAANQIWEYHFDDSGNIWRIITPSGHWRRFYWTPEQNLLYASSGWRQIGTIIPGTVGGPRDNTYNSLLRNAWDTRGNLIYSIDQTGVLDAYAYDENDRLISAYPGQGHIGVQGNWVGQYGADGYLLCGWTDAGSGAGTDVVNLPEYVSSVATTTLSKYNYNEDHMYEQPNPAVLIDPRSMVCPDPETSVATAQRGAGLWVATGTSSEPGSFTVTLEVAANTEFNLSVYSHALDESYTQPGVSYIPGPYAGTVGGGNFNNFTSPLAYAEQFGCNLEYEVTDANGTQVFQVFNNAPGVWVTFPVSTDESVTTVTLTVTAVFNPNQSGQGNVQAQIAGLAFDPYETRQTTYSYSPTGNLLSTTNPLGGQVQMSYNDDGTLATLQDERGGVTQFFYEDGPRNLTRVVDQTGAVWRMTYDSNGNVLTVEDPNTFTTTTQVDQMNRPISITNALSQTTLMSYDGAGNLTELVSALGQTTSFEYSADNRLSLITDALGGQTQIFQNPQGLTSSIVDQRGSTTAFVYDQDSRLIEVIQPNTQLVQMAMDAQDRLVAITTPNGTQASPSAINIANGGNLLRNSSVETVNPLDSSGTSAQFWLANSLGSSGTLDDTESHTGSYSLKAALTPLLYGSGFYGSEAYGSNQSFTQQWLPLGPGGRYLANAWVMKSADGVAAAVTLSAQVYDLTRTVQTLAGSATNLSGSSESWQQLSTPLAFNVPGDSQFNRFTTPGLTAAVVSQAATGTNVWLDDFTLTPLSTTYKRDYAGRIEEVNRPDGSRWRMYRDRLGRVVTTEDGNGSRTDLGYDALDRVVSVTDGLTNQTTFSFDAAGNLITVTLASTTPVTTYGSTTYGAGNYAGANTALMLSYDARNMLQSITYEDGTTEEFGYDPASNLVVYRDNANRLRTFAYDEAERLIGITYADGTTVVLTLDAVGNVLSRLERNGDRVSCGYDPLNRLVSEMMVPGGSSTTQPWAHAQTFDAVGNRTGFLLHAALYGSAVYGTDVFGLSGYTWTVSGSGYTSMNLMPGYLDALSNQVSFQYDVESRRTQITFPFGSPAVTTTAVYDIVGRLLSLSTTQGSTSILALTYGYDQASNRVGMVANSDSWDYAMDADNRLVGSSLNTFADFQSAHFAQGTFNDTELDLSMPGVKLLAWNDSFSGTQLDLGRWELIYALSSQTYLTDFVGTQVLQNEGLIMAYPRGYTSASLDAFSYQVADPYGLMGDPWGQYLGVAAQHRLQASGSLDIQVDYSDFQGSALSGTNGIEFGLNVQDVPFGQTAANQLMVSRTFSGYGATSSYEAYWQTPPYGNGESLINTTDTSGGFRITWSAGYASLEYLSEGSWTAILSGIKWNPSGTLYVALFMSSSLGVGSFRFANFQVNVPSNAYAESGTFQSQIYDCGTATPTWETLSWEATTPTGTSVQLQLASSNSVNGPWSFLGPTGASSYYTTSGASIPSTGAGAMTGRYLRYQATLAGPGSSTPELTQVMVTYAGTNPSSLATYGYDSRGNLTALDTTTSAGVANQARTFNNLDQLLQNVVTPTTGGPTTYTYVYNKDGTLASKTDGTNTWAYSWDPGGDQRLLSYSYNGVTQVAFTYDSMGRMMTRTPYSGGVAGTATQFEWDGWTVVREYTPSGTFRYYAPQGELLTFDYTPTSGSTSTYCCHADALGSIRTITNSSGTVVAHYEYDAWGNQLSSSVDMTPSFPYRFVGVWGIRWDASIEMYYSRQRWYDAGICRWVSKDQLLNSNRYVYAVNNPTDLVDYTGNAPISPAALLKQIKACRNKINQQDGHSGDLKILSQTSDLFFLSLAYSESTLNPNASLNNSGRTQYGLFQLSSDVLKDVQLNTFFPSSVTYAQLQNDWRLQVEVAMLYWAMIGARTGNPWDAFEAKTEEARVDMTSNTLQLILSYGAPLVDDTLNAVLSSMSDTNTMIGLNALARQQARNTCKLSPTGLSVVQSTKAPDCKKW